jgi:hypothetical protein
MTIVTRTPVMPKLLPPVAITALCVIGAAYFIFKA